MLSFHTPGPIPLEGINTFGLSSKSDSQIGRFGTGIKYALGVIMRHEGTVRIQHGADVRTIGVEPAVFRGKPVLYLTLDGQRLPFTTDLGRDWKPWMAFREIYANTLDEGGFFLRDNTEPPEAGWSCITVECPALDAVHDNFEEHFIDPQDTPLWSNGDLEIYAGECSQVFYKGFAVWELPRGARASFRYNIKSYVGLTEDRTASSSFSVLMSLESGIADCTNPDILRKVLHAKSFESALSFGSAITPAFAGVVQELGNDASPPALMAVAKADYQRKRSDPTLLQEQSASNQTLLTAIALLRIVGAKVDDMTFAMTRIPNGADYDTVSSPRPTIIINERLRANEEEVISTVFLAYERLRPAAFREFAMRTARERAMSIAGPR